jgi:TPP-dependent pyruvate/acetoin dehydrogenase alpha subunit
VAKTQEQQAERRQREAAEQKRARQAATATAGRSALGAAGLSEDQGREILYLLKLCRYFDERMEALYRQGRLPGAIYSGRGQEGTHVGTAYALEPEDSLFPTHRDLNAQFAKGVELKRVMAQFWGRIDGYTRGRDGNSHMGDWFGAKTFTVLSNLPNAYPPAAGAALAYKLKGQDQVALAICGDGATSNGRWHEAVNISAVHKLPVVWIINNNLWAYSTPNKLEAAIGALADRAGAYGIPGVRVDGGNVLEVYEAASEAIRRARSGEGPTVIESVSLRWRGHAGHDPAKYVPKAMLEEYMTFHDPVKNFTELMTSEGVVDEKAVEEIQKRIEKEFDEGFEYAQNSPLPDPSEATLGVFADDGFWSRDPSREGGAGQ